MTGKGKDVARVKKMAKIAKAALVVLILLFVALSLVYSDSSLAGTSGAASGAEGFTAYVKTVLSALDLLIGALAVVMVIFGGIVYATAQGNPNQVGVARDIIVSAIAGAALYAFATVLLGNLSPGAGLISKFFPPGQ